ncbi:uncharacterized protein [Coffea arabica]|uniref:Reverse transcriptase domain-containing protein n=1 Tax=Coffea arabica TaxID=13443 RepID=A0ABM4V9N3_COFAR
MVQVYWEQPYAGFPLQVLCCKLKWLRGTIRDWNRRVFGDIFQTVRQKEEDVRLAEVRVENDDSDAARMHLHLAKGQLRAALRVEELFWKQKARIIHKIRNGQGEWVESEEEIGAEAVWYFEGLFMDQHPASSSDLLQHIPTILTDEENDLLEQFPSKAEIRSAVFAMDGESASGPDGYTGKFFTVAWSVIGADVVSAVCSFFCGAELPCAVTTTSIALISKVGHLQDFSQFQLISLCNFVNKLISRVLADRLAQVLPKIISPQQSGFVRGRLISDNFLLAQELLSNMGRTSRNADVALKLDMLKTIEDYEAISGQEINVQKYGFMVHAKLPSQCVARVRRVTGFGLKSFPVRYWDLLFVGRRKCLYFMELVQSVTSKISSWSSRFLSNGGRIVLIKHVLSAVSTHLLAASYPLKGVLALVERAMVNFLWGEREGGLQHHWIKWADLCADSSQRGLVFGRYWMFIQHSRSNCGGVSVQVMFMGDIYENQILSAESSMHGRGSARQFIYVEALATNS